MKGRRDGKTFTSSDRKEDKMDKTRSSIRTETACLLVAFLLSAVMVAALVAPASADDKQEGTQLVEGARMTLQNFKGDTSMDGFRDLIKRAKGVLIISQLLKGGLIVGGTGGSGVLLVRDGKEDRWFGPGFYSIGGSSIGLQAGGQSSEVVLLIMTDRGVGSLMSSTFKLGGDAGVAAGPAGVGAAASTANLSADILTFARSKGFYGGFSLEGAVVAVRGGLNEAYYSKPVTTADIFARREVTNSEAQGLISEVTKMACTANCPP